MSAVVRHVPPQRTAACFHGAPCPRGGCGRAHTRTRRSRVWRQETLHVLLHHVQGRHCRPPVTLSNCGDSFATGRRGAYREEGLDIVMYTHDEIV